MIELTIHNAAGGTDEKVAVDEQSLGGEVNVPVLREVVRACEFNRRVGTKHVKTRGEIEATGKKMYRQKHTGNARAGSRVTNIRRGGGKAHAPEGKDWSLRIPRKVRRLAVRSALLARLRDGEVVLIENPDLEGPSTRAMAQVLRAAGVEGTCLLVVDGEPEAVQTLWKSARNIAGVEVRRACDANAYDLLRPERVAFTRAAFDAILRACAP